MFLQLNEQRLSESNFFTVFKKDRFGSYGLYYYKKGLYLKYIADGFYGVYNSEMHVVAVINNLYDAELLLIISDNPTSLN
jgi:hypothetical protein